MQLMLHAFNNQNQACSSSNATNNPSLSIPKLDYTQTILSEESTLSRSVVPAIMHMITQNFVPSPGFEKKLMTLFSSSFYIVQHLEEKEDVLTEPEITSNVQHSLTTWHFFTKLFEQYKQTKHYQNSDNKIRSNHLFDYFKGSILLSLKYNTDVNYWTKDFILFYNWIFQTSDTECAAALQQTDENLNYLLIAYRSAKEHFLYNQEYSENIHNTIQNLACFFYQWEELHSLIKIQLIEEIYQDCSYIQNNIHAFSCKRLTQQDSVKNFIEILLNLLVQVDKILTAAPEQTSIYRVELACLLEMNWRLSGIDAHSDAAIHKLILKINKNGLDYNTKLALDHPPPSPQYLPLQTTRMMAIKSSEERPDDMSLEGASKTKRRDHAI